jgi:hypothetical protein
MISPLFVDLERLNISKTRMPMRHHHCCHAKYADSSIDPLIYPMKNEHSVLLVDVLFLSFIDNQFITTDYLGTAIMNASMPPRCKIDRCESTNEQACDSSSSPDSINDTFIDREHVLFYERWFVESLPSISCLNLADDQ